MLIIGARVMKFPSSQERVFVIIFCVFLISTEKKFVIPLSKIFFFGGRLSVHGGCANEFMSSMPIFVLTSLAAIHRISAPGTSVYRPDL